MRCPIRWVAPTGKQSAAAAARARKETQRAERAAVRVQLPRTCVSERYSPMKTGMVAMDGRQPA